MNNNHIILLRLWCWYYLNDYLSVSKDILWFHSIKDKVYKIWLAFMSGWAQPILMSTPGAFPLKGKMFLTFVADLGGTSGPDLELDNWCHYCTVCKHAPIKNNLKEHMVVRSAFLMFVHFETNEIMQKPFL